MSNMEEDMILQQPCDRRLGDVCMLPPGPPGAENDLIEYEKNEDDLEGSKVKFEKDQSRKDSRSFSQSPQAKYKGQSRTKRSATPERRKRSSPSQRRYGGNFNDRRRYDNRRGRSPDWRRSSPQHDWRDRRDRSRYYRGNRSFRSNSRSRSRSSSPRQSSTKKRWSPKRNNSPPFMNNLPIIPQPTAITQQANQTQQYGIIPPPMYNESYGTVSYNQYGAQPAQNVFPPPSSSYIQGNAGPSFNPNYPPPATWDGYTQQTWIPAPVPDPTQMQTIHHPSATAAAAVGLLPIISRTDPPGAGLPDDDTSAKLHSTHDAAVAQEVENQREELKKQRASYIKKTSVLKKELNILKGQRKELFSNSGPPSPTTQGFIDENENLQTQIQRKLTTIENVIDMLTGIIGEDNFDKNSDENRTLDRLKRMDSKRNNLINFDRDRFRAKKSAADGSSPVRASSTSSPSETSEENDDDSSPERLKHKVLESMKLKQKELCAKTVEKDTQSETTEQFNYIFYDPEMHWCQSCNVFPKTARDYLNHLHSKEHMDREPDTAWHSDELEDQYPVFENAATKRTPIRGLTFFVPASAWYCKLCKIWMGDLHCASTHLKSQTHSQKYTGFLEKNPHFEVNWLADRQRALNEMKCTPLSPQITTISTTEFEPANSKNTEKTSKKRKKKSSEKKDKKKKRKHSKKRYRAAEHSSSSMSGSDTSTEGNERKVKKSAKSEGNPTIIPPSSSTTTTTIVAATAAAVDTTVKSLPAEDDVVKKVNVNASLTSIKTEIGDTTTNEETMINSEPINITSNNVNGSSKSGDMNGRTWGSVQPVITDSEKKLLEQLKGKLKKENQDDSVSTNFGRNANNIEKYEKEQSNRQRSVSRKRGDSPRRRRSRSRSHGRYRGGRLTNVYRRNRRSRSRSKGRYSPAGWAGRRRNSRSRSQSRNSRSPSRTERRRSRSYDRRRRYSRSRSHSSSKPRVEKPIVKHPEFRPRVPEKDKEKKGNDSKDRKDTKKKNIPSSPVTVRKKLPFIGKMPVFKKQTSSQVENEKRTTNVSNEVSRQYLVASARPAMPTAADINMAMMEDAFGNAPPFHPDTGIVIDYDDLMPDPVQFVNIMGQAPPPPPLQLSKKIEEDDLEVLPPGCDEVENDEEFISKSPKGSIKEDKGPLPKDLEEALNIIFPGEKKPDDNDSLSMANKAAGETQIIIEKPVMQVEDLVKEGIHLMSMTDPAIVCIDETSVQSMNEPLNFKKPHKEIDANAKNDEQHKKIQVPVSIQNDKLKQILNNEMEPIIMPVPAPTDIPMPDDMEADVMGSIYDLEDIPKPPASPKDVEKSRRQEELDDLAMLGIDADDMAAQCI